MEQTFLKPVQTFTTFPSKGTEDRVSLSRGLAWGGWPLSRFNLRSTLTPSRTRCDIVNTLKKNELPATQCILRHGSRRYWTHIYMYYERVFSTEAEDIEHIYIYIKSVSSVERVTSTWTWVPLWWYVDLHTLSCSFSGVFLLAANSTQSVAISCSFACDDFLYI